MHQQFLAGQLGMRLEHMLLCIFFLDSFVYHCSLRLPHSQVLATLKI